MDSSKISHSLKFIGYLQHSLAIFLISESFRERKTIIGASLPMFALLWPY
jgi:hypothetical protein